MRILVAISIAGAFAAACETTIVHRRPGGGGGSDPGGVEQLPQVEVEVVSRYGAPFDPVHVLVHDPSGKLRSRHQTSGEVLFVPAADGDFVSIVWWHEERSDWRIETVIATPEARRVRFHTVPAAPPKTNTKAPIHLEVDAEIVPGVSEYLLSAECHNGGPGWTSLPFMLLVDDYVGCAGSPVSMVIGRGRNEAGQLVTFDYAEVQHDQGREVSILFASTPLPRTPAEIAISWPSTVQVQQIGGRAEWAYGSWIVSEPLDGLPVSGILTPPVVVSFTRPEFPFGSAQVQLSVETGGQTWELCGLTGGVWNAGRLRGAHFDDEAGTLEPDEPGATPGEHAADVAVVHLSQPGEDAVDYRRVSWLPVPDVGTTLPLPDFEMPEDLDLPWPELPHQGHGLTFIDRFDDASYAAFIERGVGLYETVVAEERVSGF